MTRRTSKPGPSTLPPRIPTWPWEPETVRSVVVALRFPLLIWLAQPRLGRFLPG